ncbi:MAG: hypothetical protein RIS64_2879 [Bacteroidota bacterium]
MREYKNWFVTTKSIYEANKAKGLLDDLDMDYEEEFVGDEHELERSYGMTKYGKIKSAASGELAALCHSVGNKNQFFSVKGLFF